MYHMGLGAIPYQNSGMSPSGTQPFPNLADALGDSAGDKRIDILRRIAEAGSISEAARQTGVSYKAAWQAIETLGNLAGAPMVQKAVGGAGGGGAQLSPAGRQLLQAADLLHQARQDVLRRLSAGVSAGVSAGPGAAALGLRTSMRNQVPCAVRDLRLRAGGVRVALDMPDGMALSAHITRESAQLLDLRSGQPVLALCKATAV
ncbi:MAG: hypothetical protein RLZZ126_1228, partial [Pseudomonadota bacterium]